MSMSRRAGALFAVALAISCSPPGDAGSRDDFGENSAPIVGTAARSDTTHSAVVAVVTSEDSLCSGTVVHRSEDGKTLSVLTAAHCCPERPDKMTIRVGADYVEPSRTLPVASYQRHPCYNELSNDYDVCVLEVKDEGQLNIKPIPLAVAPDDVTVGDLVTFVGYGSTPARNSIRRRAAGRVIEVAQLTIGADQTNGLGGICFGDSGGPALTLQRGVEVVAGVSSFVAPSSLCNVVGVVGRVAFRGIRDDFLGKVFAGEKSELQSLLIQRQGLSPGAVRDTYLASDEPDRNFGARVDLLVGRPPDSEAIHRALVRFDLSGIPAGATLLTARVGFHEESRTGVGTLEIHRVTKDWDEASETWRSFGENGFDPTPIASSGNATAIVMISDQVWFDVTSVVRDWLAGKVGDQGILVSQPDQAQTQLLSSELGQIRERPWMHVCYLPKQP